MSLHKHIGIVFKSLVLMAMLMVSTFSSAGLINGSFIDGLDGWSGDVNYFAIIDDAEKSEFDVIFSDFADNYQIEMNGVSLNTSANSLAENWGVYLFQSFTVGNDASALSLAFESAADDAYVTLVDIDGDLLHDFMLDGLSVDLTGLVGTVVALEFGVEDFDFVYDDFLTVSNIAVTSVSEPSALAIFLFGLFVMRHKFVSRK